jgi:2-iminobutanoate/2-iminopropanoate deaminase
MKKVVYTSLAPAPIGPYSQGIIANGFLYCSGQIAIDPKTNEFINGTIEEQTLRIMQNIDELLKEAGYSFNDVVKTTCFLDDMNNFSKFNEIYAKYFISNPARSCVEAKLPKGAKVEVEIIAYKGN